MRFVKKINNNVALVNDPSGLEYIVLGKGISFGRSKGDAVPAEEVSRRFLPDRDGTLDTSLQSLVNIRPDILNIASEVSRVAERELDMKFSNHHYIILADHINFSITRMEEGIDYNDSARWEIKKLYPKEFQVAVACVEMINRKLQLILPKGEEVFITYHFVNAQNNGNKISETVKMTGLIRQMIEILEEYFNIKFDEDEFSYIRMINHLRYFFLRKIHGEEINTDDKALAEAIREKCRTEYDAVERLAGFLARQEGWKISDSEVMFLTLHLWRAMAALRKSNID